MRPHFLRNRGAILAAAIGFVLIYFNIQANASSEDRRISELVLIRPGTRVADRAPEGWSDLVLKSVPRLESGDLNSLPSIASSTATLFRSVILVNVRRDAKKPSVYVLDKVGIGIATPLDGVDTVVSGESTFQASETLGILKAEVLARGEAELKKAWILARTESFALLAAPSVQCAGGKHERILLMYAFFVDPDRGTLSTWVWSVAEEPKPSRAVKTVVRLPANLVYTCGLDVSAERLLGAVPLQWSFAMRTIPPGHAVCLPLALRGRASAPKSIAADPGAFETDFRAEILKGE